MRWTVRKPSSEHLLQAEIELLKERIEYLEDIRDGQTASIRALRQEIWEARKNWNDKTELFKQIGRLS